MRALLVVAAVLAFPAAAHAGVVGLEGTQIVFRAEPGERLELRADGSVSDIQYFHAEGVRPGPGCERVEDDEVSCRPDGVTGVTIFGGDQADRVSTRVPLPLTLALGAGNDDFSVVGATVTVDAGPGNDVGGVAGSRVSIVGGEGDDTLSLERSGRTVGPFVLDGGAGDDDLSLPSTEMVRSGPLAPVSITCGDGADRWSAGPRDVLGEGCAAHVAGITAKTVSRAFQEGALTAPASGSIAFKRRSGASRTPGATIARGVFTAQPGPLRVSLERTAAGTRWLRRTPHLPVFVTIRTRTGDDRGVVTFRSKVG
ncbi:hypothetical protein OJ997_19255 [Solirubrobacter phytolaccae]|uniref:Uncharacterized protein n=1 Tax=Solirubrobacter phytolaccae TaxID=1404360 RepID=A0A9X3N9I4_9ACTN|nr:hypothetical protein [Solirubrobacter phytolaccae]MDA0182455.1 hypothetical protein [Solirubrobacter phytolaccae]